MMAEGLTTGLVLVAMSVFFLGFFIARTMLPTLPALFVAFIKAVIPTVYFAYFFDGTWTFLDDIVYTDQGQEMIRRGYNPITALVDPEGVQQLMDLSGGTHYLYGWWNLFSQYLMGEHYYAAVFANVVVTFISALFFRNILRNTGLSEQHIRGFLVFFLLHWDLLAWSSFLNLKDILAMSLAIIGISLFSDLHKQFRIWPAIWLAVDMLLFLSIRFYMPVLLMASICIWALLFWKSASKYPLGLAFVGFLAFYFPWHIVDYSVLKPAGLYAGLARFFLTPQPWNIEESYSFLLLPSILHWAFALPALMAIIPVWIKYPLLRVLLIYMFVNVSFYAIFPDLQGPRHRVQITFIIAFLQFQAVYMFLAALKRQHTARRESVGA